jgi:hypothetical protein
MKILFEYKGLIYFRLFDNMRLNLYEIVKPINAKMNS